MVDKIVYTYRFTTLPNIDELRDDCKVWLTTILAKYDPNRGSKAFSYFSVITKNWFIHQVKKNSKRNQREVEYDKVRDIRGMNITICTTAKDNSGGYELLNSLGFPFREN